MATRNRSGQPEGPVVHVFGRVEENLDQAVPLAGIGILQKIPHPLRWRQGAGEVETDPPQELFIAGQLRGQDVQAAQLGEDELVDGVAPGDLRVVPDGIGDHGHARAGRLTGRPHHHHRFPRLHPRHQAPLGNLRHRTVIGGIEDLVGEVFPAPVGKAPHHDELRPSSGVKGDRLGQDLKAPDAGGGPFVLLAVVRPLPDPVENGQVVPGARRELRSAPVREGQGGLGQQQALLGFLQVNPRFPLPGRLGREHLVDPALHDPLVVLPGVKGVGRQLEPALAFHAAVAVVGVAAFLGQDSADLAAEAEGTGFIGGRHTNLGAGPQPLDHTRQGRRSPGHCRHFALPVEAGHRGVRNGKIGLRRQIALQAVGIAAQQHNSLGCPGPPQADLLGDQAQREGSRVGLGGGGGRAEEYPRQHKDRQSGRKGAQSPEGV